MKLSLLQLFRIQIIAFLFSGIASVSYAQNNKSNFYVSGNIHYGKILAHHDYLGGLFQGSTNAFEIDVAHPTGNNKPWYRIYHSPEVGLTIVAVKFANPDTLGMGFSIYPFINFNITHGEKFTLKFKVATSLGYITKKYDSISDPHNIAIGSNLNGFVNLRLNAQFRINNRMRIETGIGLSHFSNGAMALPNLGLNIATVNLGVGYQFGVKPTCSIIDSCSFKLIKWYLVGYTSVGLSAVEYASKQKYPAYVASINIERFNNCKNKWNTGIEFAYDGAQYYRYQNDTSINFTNKNQNIQIGIKLGYALVAGRLSMPLEWGYFIYSRIPYHNFHRIGLRYQINEYMSASITLKTRFSHADFFEFGFGYRIPLAKK